VPDHAQRQLELASLIRVAVVGQAHILPQVLQKDHIYYFRAYYDPIVVEKENIQ
jgi:hypothetical protein